MKLVDLFDAIDSHIGYIQEGYFIQRTKGDKVVSSCSGLAKGRLINFLFEKDICSKGNDTLNDLKKIAVDGKITSRGSGPNCTIEMLNILLRNRMCDEYAYVSRLVDNSVAAHIYLAAGESLLLKKKSKDSNLQNWEGNLEEVTDYVRVHFYNQFMDELTTLQELLHSRFKTELEKFSIPGTSRIRDAAMLITFLIAVSLSELTFNESSNIHCILIYKILLGAR